MYYNTIVVGSGPSGLFAASQLAKYGIKTLLVEKNQQLGKKLLVSGSGQCNFTHSGKVEDFLDKYGDNAKFVKRALLAYDNKKVLQFFRENGVQEEIVDNGKVFPKSRNSQSVVDALVHVNKMYGTTIKNNTNIINITYCDEMFSVITQNGETYLCTNLIIATGGCSYSQLGTTGWGYEVAKTFGHKIIKPRPALTNIFITDKSYKALSGISLENVQMTIMKNNKKLKDRCGTLLFTHKGLSGPLILDATRWIDAGDTLVFNVINKQYVEFEKQLEAELSANGKMQIVTYLRQFCVPKSFVDHMLTTLQIESSTVCARISKVQRKAIAKHLTMLTITVENVGDIKTAMVTAGGVSTKELNPLTFESKKANNLYFIGEVVDVDGDTGGYNIQIAFSMAYCCATAIEQKTKKD
ncbi:MAG: hypothetical protein ATN35_12810 [Epulopiscium sp. Nele67-Bin004]|nr:MAG: hypothetical protein ATN35_12810 [Epulopiscium sp. Nele67-Bin004]